MVMPLQQLIEDWGVIDGNWKDTVLRRSRRPFFLLSFSNIILLKRLKLALTLQRPNLWSRWVVDYISNILFWDLICHHFFLCTLSHIANFDIMFCQCIIGLSMYERFVNVSQVCQGLKGLLMYYWYVNLWLIGQGIMGLSKYQRFVKITRVC